MTYVVDSSTIGIQPIEATSTVKNHPLGTRVTARDQVLGGGEFIYLQGVASTIVGSLVTYGDAQASNADTWLTTLAPNTANAGKPVAVAMSVNVANQFGWYQIAGAAVIATNGTLAGAAVKVFAAGSGQVTGTAAAGTQIIGATSASATGTPAANQAIVLINHPSIQGQIT